MILIYDDTALPTGPFPMTLDGNAEAVQIAVQDCDSCEEARDAEDADYTITFDGRDVFQAWARRVAELAGLTILPAEDVAR